MKRSIRRRLLLTLLLAISAIWLIVVIYTYYGAQREVRELFDTQLQQSARVATRTLLGLPLDGPAADAGVAADDAASLDAASEGDEKYQKNLVVQVWDRDGQLFLHSQSAPRIPLSDITNGFGDSTIDGTVWRTYSFTVPEQGVTVKVGEPYQARQLLTQQVVQQSFYPVLLGLPLLALLIWFAVGRGLVPLNRIAGEVSARDPDNLETLDATDTPDEVKPLVGALNQLFDRLETTLDKERRFTADAAHELRTPLAGLKTQAQVALGATDHEERRRAIVNLLRGVDRAAHLVDQLLTLSRLDQDSSMTIAEVDLRDVVRHVTTDLDAEAADKDIDVRIGVSGHSRVRGNADAIYILLRNLLDNAIRYAPSTSTVDIALSCSAAHVTLEICDEGPGIPAAERGRVLERFYRGQSWDGQGSGSGLGLSIVKRIADLHGARFEIASPARGSGLIARIDFPAFDDDAESTAQRHTTANSESAASTSRHSPWEELEVT